MDKMIKRGRLSIHLQNASQLSKEWGEGQQREGIALAKQRGAYRGRKKSLNSEQVAELKRRVEAGEQKALVARDFSISRETLYQYLRQADHTASLTPFRHRD